MSRLVWMALLLPILMSCTERPDPDAAADPPARRTEHAPLGEGDWPSFRGNPQLTGAAVSALPEEPELLWTYEAGSPVSATAAVVGGRVYVGTHAGTVICIDLLDGTRKWQAEVGDVISAAPLVHDGTVYVGDESGWLRALDAETGEERWSYKANAMIMSAATPAGDAILFGSYDFILYCLDAETGEERWTLRTGNYVHASPCVAGDRVVVAGCDGKVRMIDLETGEQTAELDTRDNFAGSAAYKDGHVYLGDMGGTRRAVRTADMTVAWEKADDVGSYYASAAVQGDRVVFASQAGTLLCADRATGEVLWTAKMDAGMDSSPVIVGDRVFVGTDGGTLAGVRLSDGSAVWSFSAGAAITASPAAGRGRLVVGTDDGAVYCFGPGQQEAPGR